MSTVSPEGLAREARRRFVEDTGTHWQHASLNQRRRWWRDIEPVLRAEHGIAADAVYSDGVWQPPGQLDLFHEPTTHGSEQ